jgi:hypothetical protein
MIRNPNNPPKGVLDVLGIPMPEKSRVKSVANFLGDVSVSLGGLGAWVAPTRIARTFGKDSSTFPSRSMGGWYGSLVDYRRYDEPSPIQAVAFGSVSTLAATVQAMGIYSNYGVKGFIAPAVTNAASIVVEVCRSYRNSKSENTIRPLP